MGQTGTEGAELQVQSLQEVNAERIPNKQQDYLKFKASLMNSQACQHCHHRGNAGSPNKSRPVCAQPRPLSTDSPAATNQLVSIGRHVAKACLGVQVDDPQTQALEELVVLETE